MLAIESFVLGPVETNSYLVADTQVGSAVVIDPAWEGEKIAAAARRRGWQIAQIWITHAHFDHFAGASGLVRSINPPPPVALHPADLPLWRMQGGAPLFGMQIDPGPAVAMELAHGQLLRLGEFSFEVRHVPGHSPGHVIFCCAEARVAFCGDVIFAGGIGRTDLPGGDYDALIHGIRTWVLTLPDETRLLSGHGPETTVGIEKKYNMFLI